MGAETMNGMNASANGGGTWYRRWGIGNYSEELRRYLELVTPAPGEELDQVIDGLLRVGSGREQDSWAWRIRSPRVAERVLQAVGQGSAFLRGLAANTHLTDDIYLRLWERNRRAVGKYLCRNPNIGDNTRAAIFEDLRQRPNADEAPEWIDVAAMIQRVDLTYSEEEIFATSEHFGERELHAYNPNSRPELLHVNVTTADATFEDFDGEVRTLRVAVAKNRNTSADTLRWIAEAEEEYIQAHGSEEFVWEIWEAMVESQADSDVRVCAAINARTSHDYVSLKQAASYQLTDIQADILADLVADWKGDIEDLVDVVKAA